MDEMVHFWIETKFLQTGKKVQNRVRIKSKSFIIKTELIIYSSLIDSHEALLAFNSDKPIFQS